MPGTITLEGGTRPKAATTSPLAIELDIKDPVYSDAENTTTQRYTLNGVVPNPATFNVTGATTTTGQPVVTGNFANVQPGDGVTGTGIPASTKVASKQSPNQITLSGNATATGTATLTFTPPTADRTLFTQRNTLTMQGANLQVKVEIFQFDGKVSDANGDGDDEATIAQANPQAAVGTVTFNVNVDEFLTNARSARS